MQLNQIMKSFISFRIVSLILALTYFAACGRWNPATSSDMHGTVEHRKEKGGDRYRFIASDGKKVEASGKNLNIEGSDLLVQKGSRQYRLPLDQVQDIQKYQFFPGRTWALILGITAGVLGATAAAAFIAAGDDTGS